MSGKEKKKKKSGRAMVATLAPPPPQFQFRYRHINTKIVCTLLQIAETHVLTLQEENTLPYIFVSSICH